MRDLLLAAVNRMESKGLSIRQNCMEFESEGKRKKERQKDSQSVGRQQAESERDISDERCSYGITDGGGGMKKRQRD